MKAQVAKYLIVCQLLALLKNLFKHLRIGGKQVAIWKLFQF